MASRQQVADYLSGNLIDPRQRKMAMQAAAAWLMSTGRSRQAKYLAKDVAAVLASKGHVLVEVTTARPLAAAAREQIEAYVKRATGARHLELDAQVDASLIGGAIIETPDAVLDASLKTKLATYVEGVIS